MRARVKAKLEMFVRAQAFVKAHPLDELGQTAIAKRLSEQLSEAQETATQQEQARIAERSANHRRATLRRQVQELLQYLFTVWRTTPEVPPADFPGRLLPIRDYIVAVGSSVRFVRPHEGKLLANGLSSTLLDEVLHLVAELEETWGIARKSRVEYISAREKLRFLVTQLSSTVKLVNEIYRYHYGGDSDFMAEWDMVRALAPDLRKRLKEDAA